MALIRVEISFNIVSLENPECIKPLHAWLTMAHVSNDSLIVSIRPVLSCMTN